MSAGSQSAVSSVSTQCPVCPVSTILGTHHLSAIPPTLGPLWDSFIEPWHAFDPTTNHGWQNSFTCPNLISDVGCIFQLVVCRSFVGHRGSLVSTPEPWVLGVLVMVMEAYRPMYDRCCGNSYLAAAGGGWRVIWTNYNPDTQSSTRRSLSRPGWREH